MRVSKIFRFFSFAAGVLAMSGVVERACGEGAIVPDDVVLLVGQSNMAGRAKLEEEDKGVIDGVLLWNREAERWEPATAPLNRYSKLRKTLGMQRLNPGVGFAKAYRKANPDKVLGIVCSARGGTRIEEWADDQPLYLASVAATKAALSKGGSLLAILWHQGESNAKAPDAYPGKLKTLVETYRAEFEKAELPFVFAEIGKWRDSSKPFNAMIVKQPDLIPNTACVRADGLTAFDAAHFDTPSQRELGKRYFAALADLLGKE